MSLIKKVKSHCRGQLTSGRATLALAVECIDHMFGPSGDWSPLATLISESQPAQSRSVKKIVRKVVQGWSWSDKTARFTKTKGANQGVDTDALDRIRRLVADKKSVQSSDVVELVAGEKREPKAREDASVVRSAVKAAKKNHIDREAFLKMCEALWNEVEVSA